MNQPTPQLIRMKKWMRNSTIDFFNRNPDVIAAPSFVSLSSKMVVDVLTSGFEVMTRDTHFITCRARQILTQNVKGDVYQEDELFKAEMALNAHFERVHEFFDTRISQGEMKLTMAGFEPNELQRIVTNYETRTVTNGVTQYLDILVKADIYTTILHYLWVTGELADSPDESLRHKLNTEREIRQHLFGLTRASNTHYNNVRRLCNGIVDIRRKERQEQAKRDYEREAASKAQKAAAEAKAEKRREKARQKRNETRQSNIADAQREMNKLVPEAVAA